jgi:hypothetical protein
MTRNICGGLSLTGEGLVYQGVWDANTNNPPLASGVGTKGDYYVVGVSGNTNLDGITDWVVGDWVVFNGLVWEKADHTDVVTSVFGRQGPVVAVAGDYDFPKITGTISDLQHGNRSGGTLHPTTTPDPGGVAGFMSSADKQKLNGVAANAARVQDYQFGRNVQVPGGGTLALYGPGNTLVGVRMNRAGAITGASIQVGAVDAARDYSLIIYKNGGQVASVALPSGSLGADAGTLAVAVVAGDRITSALVRTVGVGASTFVAEHAIVEVTY